MLYLVRFGLVELLHLIPQRLWLCHTDCCLIVRLFAPIKPCHWGSHLQCKARFAIVRRARKNILQFVPTRGIRGCVACSQRLTWFNSQLSGYPDCPRQLAKHNHLTVKVVIVSDIRPVGDSYMKVCMSLGESIVVALTVCVCVCVCVQVNGEFKVVGGKDAWHQIIQYQESIGGKMIVIGTRGANALRRTLMGSVSDSVVHHAHCPVLVCRHTWDCGCCFVNLCCVWVCQCIPPPYCSVA